jgi:hypothetical protein
MLGFADPPIIFVYQDHTDRAPNRRIGCQKRVEELGDRLSLRPQADHPAFPVDAARRDNIGLGPQRGWESLWLNSSSDLNPRLGRLSARLEYAEVGEVVESGVTRYLQDVRQTAAEAALAVHDTYFL